MERYKYGRQNENIDKRKEESSTLEKISKRKEKRREE